MKEKSGGNIFRYENHFKKLSNVIRIVICLIDRLTIMLPEGRRGPKGNRKKVGKRLTVEKTVRTRPVNVEMIFKNEIFFRKTKNSPKYQLLKCRMFRNEKLSFEYQLLRRRCVCMNFFSFFKSLIFFLIFFFVRVLIFFRFRRDHYFFRNRLMVGMHL